MPTTSKQPESEGAGGGAESLRLYAFVFAVLAAMFVAAVAFRPLLPIDETRYASAAWEMFVRGDWFAPLTVNFQPYHHKPPMLFWLVNLSWHLFGVSRWAAALAPSLCAFGALILTGALARRIMPAQASRAPLVMLGSAPFVIYSTLVMFDITLTVSVLGAMLCFLAYAGERKLRWILLAGLLLGTGVLTKGPVAYLYVFFPVVLAPLWISREALAAGARWRSWYWGALAAVLVSAIPVLLWLVPVLEASSKAFDSAIVWDQTMGRITGNYENVHHRPVYFYLPLLPVLFLPWALAPSFWRNMKGLRESYSKGDPALKFLLCWLVPTVLAFSLIGGKQPHYLVPLLPGVAILTARLLEGISARAMRIVILAFALVYVCGHAVAARTFFPAYDLGPVARFVQDHRESDWAYVRKYQGEITFLARLEKPLESMDGDVLPQWFAAHPQGYAVIRYKHPEEVRRYEALMTMPYRERRIGVFALRPGGAVPPASPDVSRDTRPEGPPDE